MTAGAIGGWIVDIDLKNRNIEYNEDTRREQLRIEKPKTYKIERKTYKKVEKYPKPIFSGT